MVYLNGKQQQINSAGGITIPGFKTYYRAIGMLMLRAQNQTHRWVHIIPGIQYLTKLSKTLQ